MFVVDSGSDYIAMGTGDQNNGGLLNLNAVSGSTVLTMTTRSGTDAHTNIFTMFKTPATSGTPTATASGDILGDIRFMGVNTSAVADIGAQIVVEQTGTASGTVPAQMSFVTNEATAMSINSAGNIGMGATGTNIDAKLHVVGSALVGTAAANTTIDDSLSTGLDVAVGSGTKAFQVWDDGDTTTPRLAVLRNGNVGIGVSIPQCKLDIDVAIDTSLGLRSQSGIIVAQYTGAPAVGRRAQIGLGYGNTYTNVSIGAVRTSATAYGTDDFIIATKSGTTDAAPTERVRILATGGITFNGDTATANALDDYEEGTWRPVVHSGSTAVTLEHQDTVQGAYTKIGRLVTLHMEIDVNNMNSATGLINITGLPFAVANNIAPTGIEASGSVAYFAGWATSVFTVGIYATAGSGLLNMTMQTAAQQAVLDVNGDDIGTGEFRASITYFSG